MQLTMMIIPNYKRIVFIKNLTALHPVNLGMILQCVVRKTNHLIQ